MYVTSEFGVDVRKLDPAVVIAVRGELDLASCPSFEAELDRAWSSDSLLVVVDLRELDFMDSTGLSALVRARQRSEELGRGFSLVRGRPQVMRLLSLTGVDERLTLIDAPEDALDGS